MKQLQYFTLASFLLVKALSPAELTIKDIKPHIDQLENEFIALTNEVNNLIGEYKKSIGDEFNFHDDSLFGEIREGGRNKEERAAKRHERRTQENKTYFEKRTTLGEERKNKEKEEKEKAKTEKLHKESGEKAKILNNLKEILQKSNKETFELKSNNENIEIVKILPKDIKDGAQKKVEEFSVIFKTAEELNNIKNLRTFNQIKEFTHNFNYSKILVKKNININYLYNIFLSILTQKEKNILELAPILDLNKDEITKLRENKTDQEKIKGICNKITNIIYKYSIAFENINKPDIDKFDEFILKNQLSFDYTDGAELNKKNRNYFDDENKIVKKDFKNKSLNNMKLSTVFSSKKDENKVAAESPKLLALLNRFKGTEEENKAMSVKQAVNIIIDFLRLRKSLGYIETTEKRKIEYKSTTDERESKIVINTYSSAGPRGKDRLNKSEEKEKENKNQFAESAKKEREGQIDKIKKDFSANDKELEDKKNKKIHKNIFISIDSIYNNTEASNSDLTEESLNEKYKKAQDLINEALKKINTEKEPKIYKEIQKNLHIYNNLKFELANSNLNKKEEKIDQKKKSKPLNKIKKEALDKLKEYRVEFNELRKELKIKDKSALEKIDEIYNKTNINLNQKKEEASKKINTLEEKTRSEFIKYNELKFDLKKQEEEKFKLFDKEKNKITEEIIVDNKILPQSKSHVITKGKSLKKSSNQSQTSSKKSTKKH